MMFMIYILTGRMNVNLVLPLSRSLSQESSQIDMSEEENIEKTVCVEAEADIIAGALQNIIRGLLDDTLFHESIQCLCQESTPYFHQFTEKTPTALPTPAPPAPPILIQEMTPRSEVAPSVAASEHSVKHFQVNSKPASRVESRTSVAASQKSVHGSQKSGRGSPKSGHDSPKSDTSQNSGRELKKSRAGSQPPSRQGSVKSDRGSVKSGQRSAGNVTPLEGEVDESPREAELELLMEDTARDRVSSMLTH